MKTFALAARALRLLALPALLAATPLALHAQDDETDKKLDYNQKTDSQPAADALKAKQADSARTWTAGFLGSLTFNQQALSNWAAGGDGSLSLNATAGAFLNFEKNKHYWFNLLDASYGITKVNDLPIRKTQDYWEFNTKYGYRFAQHWSFTAFGELISQFAYGYDYKADPEATRRTSSLMSPAFANQGLGITYEQPDWGLSARLSPITAREIIVLDDAVNEVAYGIDTLGTVKLQLGASLRINYKKTFFKSQNTTLESRLLVFSDYLNQPEKLVVNWRNKVDFKITTILTVSLILHLIYDPSIVFPAVVDGNGTVTKPAGTRLQVLQSLGVGLAVRL